MNICKKLHIASWRVTRKSAVIRIYRLFLTNVSRFKKDLSGKCNRGKKPKCNSHLKLNFKNFKCLVFKVNLALPPVFVKKHAAGIKKIAMYSACVLCQALCRVIKLKLQSKPISCLLITKSI